MPKLESLGLPQEAIQRLRDCELHVNTVERLWVHDEVQLADLTKIPVKTLEELRMKCGMRLCPPLTVHESCRVQARPSPDPLPGLHPTLFTAEEELQHHKRGSFAVSTGSTSVDALLERRGFLTRQMTEIIGPSASGKTQLCMTAAVRVAAMRGSVLYIDANGSACPRRLKQLAAEIAGKEKVVDVLSRIRVCRIFTESQLMDALDALGQKMLAADPEFQDLRMIVVDPIKAFLSPVMRNRDGERNGQFFTGIIGRSLNYLALRYDLLVLAVNGTLAERTGDGRDDVMQSERPSGKPALGPSWALFPSVRVLLAVQDRDDNTTSFTATILSAVGQASGGLAAFSIGAAGVQDVQP